MKDPGKSDTKGKGKKKMEDPPDVLQEVDIFIADEVPVDATPHPVEVARSLPSPAATDEELQQQKDKFWKEEMERVEKLVEPYGDDGKPCAPMCRMN
jgi:hypothetical protein